MFIKYTKFHSAKRNRKPQWKMVNRKNISLTKGPMVEQFLGLQIKWLNNVIFLLSTLSSG